MSRAVGAILLTLAVLVAGQPQPAKGAEPAGSVTWVVDHKAKTITVTVQLQIYSGCSGGLRSDSAAAKARACRDATSQVTPFLAQKVKSQIEAVWNKGYYYRCYRLIFVVDVTVAPDRSHLDADRIGVRIDPSPMNIRSWVDAGGSNNTDAWQSNDPADRLVPENGHTETTWTEGGQNPRSPIETYAHEFGHILGLHDTYKDAVGADGDPHSVPIPGAPVDLMQTAKGGLNKETINRLVERNSNRMVDTSGRPVSLDDLTCDLRFVAQLIGNQKEYGASNLQSSRVAAPCSRAPVTSSIDQRVDFKSEPVKVRVLEDAQIQPMGYLILPEFDVLTLQNGLTGGGRSAAAVGLFDLPANITVQRFRDSPARGDIPPVFDFPDTACAGGDTGHGPSPDCGLRRYDAWLAMSQQGTELWPVSSSLPALLKDIGYSQPRLEKLYKNCSGPEPWPGAFVDTEQGVHVVRGKMPALSVLKKVSSDWYHDGQADTMEIDGTADVDNVQTGNLVNDQYFWTVVLCPLNKDDEPPPGCLS